METLENLLFCLAHIDQYLIALVSNYGIWTYVALFLVIFLETGVVIFPFLPGDSLVFAAGSIAANSNGALSIQLLLVTLILASILGNKINYLIGRLTGPRIFTAQHSWLLNKKHLEEAHQFYKTHGGKTIIFARFLPIIRTFAPFVAGIGLMNATHFAFFNLISAVLWIGSLLGAGYFFGDLSFVKDHFSLVIYGIITISLLPALITFCLKKRKSA